MAMITRKKITLTIILRQTSKANNNNIHSKIQYSRTRTHLVTANTCSVTLQHTEGAWKLGWLVFWISPTALYSEMNKCFRKLALSPSSGEMVRRHWVGPTEARMAHFLSKTKTQIYLCVELSMTPCNGVTGVEVNTWSENKVPELDIRGMVHYEFVPTGQSTKFTTWKYWKDCVKKLDGNDPNFLPTTHGSCITTMHLLTRHCLWGSF